MIDQKDIGLILAAIGRISSQVTMLKAFNQVILREVCKTNGSSYADLIKDVESLNAQYVIDNSQAFEDLISKVLNEDPNKPMTYGDLLRMLGK